VRHRPYIRDRSQSVVLIMVAPASIAALTDLVAFHGGDLLLRTDRIAAEDKAKLPPIYELAWNHTTLRGLKIDPTITYLQAQYPDLEHVKRLHELLGDEMPMHLEMMRFDGQMVFAGLPIVRYTSEARLEEIIRIHEDNGCLIFNPHRYTLEEGGMKKTDRAQFAFKKEADPNGLLNPGKMIAWDDPDFDFDSGRVWLFSGLQTLGAA
jgi:SAM-dependent methyltransferase